MNLRTLKKAKKDFEKKYTISSPDKELLERLDKFLEYIRYCSSVGHSASVVFDIDGDGPDYLEIKGTGKYDFEGEDEPEFNVKPNGAERP